MDHVAAHFAQQKRSNRVFNYYCRICGVRFFLKGMCLGCKCNARGGGEQFIPLKSGITLEDMKRETSFLMFVRKWIVPVLDDIPDAPPANSVRPQTSVSTDEVEVEEHGPIPTPQERLPSPKRGRPPTPYPRSSSPETSARTPHLPKSARNLLSRTPAAFAQEEDSDVVTSEGNVRKVSRTPLHYPQGKQFYDDEEKVQLPACPSLSPNRSDSSALNFLKDGNSLTRMNEDGQNRAEKWDSFMGKPRSFDNDLSRSEVLTTSASSTPPTAHPSSNTGAQQHSVEPVVKAVEKQHNQPCSSAELSALDLASNITTSSAASPTHVIQDSSSLPSAQTSFSSLDIRGDTASDYDRVLLPPPPPPPPLNAKESASQSECEHSSTTAQRNKNAKKRPATTVRVLNKKSRQDGLLEENPSPPRLSRRLSRSPGIHGSKTPTYKQSGPKTPDYESQNASDSCPGLLEKETISYPAPTLEFPVPASRTPNSSPSTSFDKGDGYNGTRNTHERSAVLSVPNGEGETDQTSNNRPDALPPPLPPPFFPPPFPLPPYPYMVPGPFPMPPLPFSMYSQFGPPPPCGMPYPGPLAHGTPPPGVPQRRPASAPSLGMPAMGYRHPCHPVYYYPPQ